MQAFNSLLQIFKADDNVLQELNLAENQLTDRNIDELSEKQMVTVQNFAEVEDDINPIEEYDDTAEEDQINKAIFNLMYFHFKSYLLHALSYQKNIV